MTPFVQGFVYKCASNRITDSFQISAMIKIGMMMNKHANEPLQGMDPDMKNALIGAGIGGLAGWSLGGQTKHVLAGAGLGGLGGYMYRDLFGNPVPNTNIGNISTEMSYKDRVWNNMVKDYATKNKISLDQSEKTLNENPETIQKYIDTAIKNLGLSGNVQKQLKALQKGTATSDSLFSRYTSKDIKPDLLTRIWSNPIVRLSTLNNVFGLLNTEQPEQAEGLRALIKEKFQKNNVGA